MKNKKYIVFFNNYPSNENPLWIANVKYMVKDEFTDHYLVGNSLIDKGLENQLYNIHYIKNDKNFDRLER